MGFEQMQAKLLCSVEHLLTYAALLGSASIGLGACGSPLAHDIGQRLLAYFDYLLAKPKLITGNTGHPLTKTIAGMHTESWEESQPSKI